MNRFFGQFPDNSILENKKNLYLSYFYIGLTLALCFLFIYDVSNNHYQFVLSHIVRIIVLALALKAISLNKTKTSVIFTITLFLISVIYNSFTGPKYCYDSLILFPLSIGLFTVIRKLLYNLLFIGLCVLIFCIAEYYKIQNQHPAFGLGEIIAIAVIFICFFSAMSFIAFEFKHYERMLEQKNTNLQELVSQLKDKNENLEKSNQFINQIMGVIAHDLRNPFNTLIGYSNLLHNNFASYDIQKQKLFISQILNCSQNGYQILENLLNWTQSTSNRLTINLKHENIYDLFRMVLMELTFSMDQKEIVIIPEAEPTLEWVTDQVLLSSVVRNILSNSIKFSNKKSSVRLNATCINNTLEIMIENTGPEISKEMQLRILDPKHSITTNGTLGERGTGLGLIICQDFITRLQGTLEIDSTLESTQFIIKLPVLNPNEKRHSETKTDKKLD